MDRSALEVALALLRMPSMRASLQQRPLPGEVSEVIELAAGSPHRLARAAARMGEPPGDVLEAARFYIREVLLCADADAYRVLGVPRDAAPAQIKAHHRALQHWLHPDRRGDDWESIYATHINTAWGELRTPDRRAAYDARMASGSDSVDVSATQHRVLVSDWRAAPGNRSNQAGSLALIAVVVGCVWLAVLVDRQASAPAPEWNVTAEETAVSARTSVQPTPAAAVDRPATIARPKKVVDTVAKPAKVRRAAAEGVVPPPAVAAVVVEGSKPANVPPVSPVRAPSKVQRPIVTPVVRGPVIRGAMSSDDTKASPLVAAEPRSARVRTPALAVPTATEPVIARQTSVDRAPAAPPATDIDPLERARLAQRRGRDVTLYLASSSSHVPPIWRSVAAQDAAASIRDRLEGRRRRIMRMIGRVQFGDPTWRIAADRAIMTSTIARTGSRANAATLRVELAWRDGMWLVDTIETENLQ